MKGRNILLVKYVGYWDLDFVVKNLTYLVYKILIFFVILEKKYLDSRCIYYRRLMSGVCGYINKL